MEGEREAVPSRWMGVLGLQREVWRNNEEGLDYFDGWLDGWGASDENSLGILIEDTVERMYKISK